MNVQRCVSQSRPLSAALFPNAWTVTYCGVTPVFAGHVSMLTASWVCILRRSPSARLRIDLEENKIRRILSRLVIPFSRILDHQNYRPTVNCILTPHQSLGI